MILINLGYSQKNSHNNGKSAFNKIGNDIIFKKKPNINVKNQFMVKKIIKFPEIKTNRAQKVSKHFILSNGLDNTINEIMDYTKDFTVSVSASPLHNKIENNTKKTLIKVNDSIIEKHSIIWTIMFRLEVNVENKINFHTEINILLRYIDNCVIREEPEFELFINEALSKGYKIVMKVSFIMLICLKFILLNFSYDKSLKKTIKEILFSLNNNLLSIIKYGIITDENNILGNIGCSKISKDCITLFKKLNKKHKIQDLDQPINSFGVQLLKNIDISIVTIKKFSTNFFKDGYFTNIYTICINLLKNLDLYTIYRICSLITKSVLFYIMNKNQIAGQDNYEVTNDKNPIIGSIGKWNIPIPYLPKVNEKTYTLVLDLDETLVHYFLVKYISFIIFL